MQEQNKYDQIPFGLLDRLKRILPFADIVVEEIVCEETDLLETIIPRMFEVMHRAARISCNYVRHGKWSSVWIWLVLMVTASAVGGPGYLRAIEEIDTELSKITKDFMRAVDVETLRLAKRSSKHLLS